MVFLSWISLFTALSIVPIKYKTPLSPCKNPFISSLREKLDR